MKCALIEAQQQAEGLITLADGSQISHAIARQLNPKKCNPQYHVETPAHWLQFPGLRFTLAQLRRWKPIRNDRGVIIGVDRLKSKQSCAKRITAKQARSMLSELLAYIDGEHNDDTVITRARQLAA